MILIVGLGNPGKKYQYTRHNIGFEIIDSFFSYFKFPDFKSKFNGLYSKKNILGKNIIIFKPQTFMNLSGDPIKKIREYFKIGNSTDMILIHDDIDMNFLKLRIKSKGGHGGHNGIKDTIKFNGENFYRIKLGVKNKLLEEKKIKPEHFVLEKFDKSERIQIGNLKEIINQNFEFLINKDFSLLKTKISADQYGV